MDEIRRALLPWLRDYAGRRTDTLERHRRMRDVALSMPVAATLTYRCGCSCGCEGRTGLHGSLWGCWACAVANLSWYVPTAWQVRLGG